MIKETCRCGATIEVHKTRYQEDYKEAEIVNVWRKEHKCEKKVEITHEPPITSMKDWRLESIPNMNDPDIIG